MPELIPAVDSVTGRFGPLVENALIALMEAAITEGVTDAVEAMPDIATAVGNALAPLTTVTALRNANALPSAAKNLLTGWFHCDGYGAVGDGTTIARSQIQAALTAAGAAYTATGTMQRVYLPAGVYLVDAVTYLNDDGSTFGVVSLMLPSGVDFFGPGTIKVKDGAYGDGALFGVIRSKSGGISSSKIRELRIDGNRAGNVASPQCDNISLNAVDDIEISRVRSLNANGNGILVNGKSATPATNVRIFDCHVTGASRIGIQVSRFFGVNISRNVVGDCDNNGIDVYGENGNTSTLGNESIIDGNRVFNCSVGIFPETVSYVLVSNNLIKGCTESSIHVNRINGAPNGVTISNNLCVGGPIGIFVTGDMSPGAIRIRANTIDAVTSAGIELGGGGSNVSFVYIAGNFIDTLTLNSVPLVHVASGTPVWSQTVIRDTITKNTSRSLDVFDQAASRAGSVSFDQAND